MSAYTIEDIEMIRRKSGISYQEAVALLDYHDGNVTRALIDLERNGKLQAEKDQPQASASSTREGNKGANIFQRLYRARVKLHKGTIQIVNLSALFCILAAIISPHLAVISVIVSLILGYRISVNLNDSDFMGENLQRMVKNAAQNARNAVSDIAKGFSDAVQERKEPVHTEPVQNEGSYYQSNPASARGPVSYGRTADIPVMQMPVKVESQDGSVSIEKDTDGYSSATIG